MQTLTYSSPLLAFVYLPPRNTYLYVKWSNNKSSTHSPGIVHQFKVRFWSFLPPFWLEEVRGLSKVVVMQSCFEGYICCLWKHTLFFQDGENTHRLDRRKRERGGKMKGGVHIFVHSQISLHTECS